MPSGVFVRARIARIRSHGDSTPRRTALSKTPPPETSSAAKPAPSSSSARSRIDAVGTFPTSGSWLRSRTVVSTRAGTAPSLTLSRAEAGERVDREVAGGQHERQRDGHPDAAGVRERVGDPRPDVREQRAGPDDEVPAVPPERAAEVDAERAERQAGRDEHPAPDPAVLAADNPLHEEDREEPEQHPGPGERPEEDDVEPKRRVGARAEVDEIREEVRRVRQEEEPDRRERDQMRQARTAALSVVHGNGRGDRDPGQEEVP